MSRQETCPNCGAPFVKPETDFYKCGSHPGHAAYPTRACTYAAGLRKERDEARNALREIVTMTAPHHAEREVTAVAREALEATNE